MAWYIEDTVRHCAKKEIFMNVAISKLDTALLRRLMRLDPDRIVAEDATPEAIEACRLLGVELLLSPDSGSRDGCWAVDADSVDDETACVRDIYADRLHELARKVGIRVVLAKSDTSGIEAASAKEAERILANTAVHVCSEKIDSEPRRRGRPRKHPDTKAAQAAASRAYRARKKFFMDAGRELFAAAEHIKGKSYEECMEIAKRNPSVRAFMISMGENGSDLQRQMFGYAQECVQDEELLARWRSKSLVS